MVYVHGHDSCGRYYTHKLCVYAGKPAHRIVYIYKLYTSDQKDRVQMLFDIVFYSEWFYYMYV